MMKDVAAVDMAPNRDYPETRVLQPSSTIFVQFRLTRVEVGCSVLEE